MHIRHNAIRDTEAKIMQEVAHDVKIEPNLQSVSPIMKLKKGSNTADNARLDVSAKGIFSSHEVTFFDIRITNPNNASNCEKPLSDIYKKHEQEKMGMYNDRVLQVEKSSFVPLVYTTSGGMGPQNETLHKRLANLIAEQRKERFSDVMDHIRTRLRFALLKSILTAVRGRRGKKMTDHDLSNISFNLIPASDTYESF